MHLILGICFGIIFSLLSLHPSAQAAEASLNGAAIHSEFGKEQFIGAFYSSTVGDKADDFAHAQTMRMELKIVAAEGITTRRFSRMWIEGMSINNDPALLTAEADNMVIFDSAFKARLEKNDSIIFSYEQTKGVDIIVNNIVLDNIPSDKFFSMLLRTWIGKVPLSTDYKNGILKAGNTDPDLINRFDSIKPSKERSLKIADWLKAKATPVISDAQTSAASSLSKAAIEPNKQTAASESSQKSSHKSELAIASAVNPKSNKQTVTKQDLQKSEEDDEKSILTSQSLLTRQFYISDLLKKIRSNTRYPARANELRQSGSLRIALVIDREGNILSARFIQGSEYPLLNEAALYAIKKSAPLPAMPDTLTGASFEFTVPMNFVAAKK